MEYSQHIFNRKLLDKKLENFNINKIPESTNKIAILKAWKYSIENSDLDKTKEEAVQGDFLTAFFTDVLGYKKRYGNSLWNIQQEQKSKTDGSKADGALGFFTSDIKDVRVVIELKDAKTNLDRKQKNRENKLSAVEQAFSYASKSGKNCNWVIVSNFREIRLYHSSDQSEYERFLITDLIDEMEFRRFYFLLNSENLINRDDKSNIDKLYSTNEAEQQSISKLFYRDYKETRSQLFQNLKEQNPEQDELLLFEKSQKLMDRFIFVCFCEDTDLLPEHIFRRVIEAARNSFDLSDQRIWNQLKGLFHSIDKGNTPHNINKFNGGLFKEDLDLDNLIIPDKVFTYLENISSYDFGSDLNVNILGHIFEQSISDIEEIKSEIRGESVNLKKGKRKKDGIYYTPEYITRYIVEQAIGSWLEDRRNELGGEVNLPEIPEPVPKVVKGVSQKTLAAQRAVRTKAINRHFEFWEAYRSHLSKIKILDPACGSGAFLNQAFNYLFSEGQRVNSILDELTGGQASFYDLDKHILKNNLFGVDLNPESVEITKLALWIKTANKYDELTTLDENILSGNSLIYDPDIVGEDAFNWEIGFSEIMENGGFDVIIGNPPWGAKLDAPSKKYLKDNYPYSNKGKVDTYKYFYEKTFKLISNTGYVSMITPNTFLYNTQSDLIRKGILEHFDIREGLELRKNIFEDAPDVVPAILLLKREKTKSQHNIIAKVAFHNVKMQDLSINEWMLNQNIPQKQFEKDKENKLNFRLHMGFVKIKDRMEKKYPTLEKYFDLRQGTKPYGDKEKKEVELISRSQYNKEWDKAINGRNISQYAIDYEGEYVWRTKHLYSCLSDNILAGEKLYFQRMRKISLYPRIVATYDSGEYHGLYTCSTIFSKPGNKKVNIKYLLCLLNSNLINRWYQNFDTDIEIKLESVKKIPIVVTSRVNQQKFIDSAELLLNFNREKYLHRDKFLKYLVGRYSPSDISRKLKNFHKIDYKEFVKELKRQKGNISEKEMYDLMDIFEEEKKVILSLSSKVQDLTSEINDMVYELYSLTEEEIAMVKSMDSFEIKVEDSEEDE